jgi:hypothetical protein
MWTPRPDDTKAVLRAASIGIVGGAPESPLGTRSRLPVREIHAVVEAPSPVAALARVRAAVADLAAVVRVEEVDRIDGLSEDRSAPEVSVREPAG